MAEQQQDVDALKRRGRRRLVGSVALVLAAVIVLPMVFDPAPRSPSRQVSVRIPGEDDTPFQPKLPPKIAAEISKPAESKTKVAKLEATSPPTATKEPGKPDPAEMARAQAALSGGQYFVPVGAFAAPASVIARLVEAKLPYYTEELAIAKGKVTRVRAGPFSSKAAAEKAAERLKGLGFKPGNVAEKS